MAAGATQARMAKMKDNHKRNVWTSTALLADTMKRFFPSGCCKIILQYAPGTAHHPGQEGEQKRADLCAADINPLIRKISLKGGRWIYVVKPDGQSVTLLVSWGKECTPWVVKCWSYGPVMAQELEAGTDWPAVARDLMAPHLEAGHNAVGYRKGMWSHSRKNRE